MDTKVCCRCNQELPREAFVKVKNNKDGLTGTCRKCRNKRRNEWRAEYKEKNGEPENRRYNQGNLEYYAKSKAARVARNKYYVLRQKYEPCVDCGVHFPPICMDFDHVNGDKVAGISRMVNGAVSLDKLQAEINKCELVCSNCHRIRTYNRDKPWTEKLRVYDRSTWYEPVDYSNPW